MKIQSLLHLCSEYFGEKEEGGGGEGEGEKSEGKKSGETGTDISPSIYLSIRSPIYLFYILLIGKRKAKSGDDKETKKEDKSDPGSLNEPGSHQALAVLGIALISMGEDIGAEMSLRTFNHVVSNHVIIM